MRTRVVALAAATATALSGCSMLSSDSDSSGSSGSSESSQSEGSGEGSEVNADTQENGAIEAGFDPANPPEPIAKSTMVTNQGDVETTTIELLELRRDENVMLATFRLTGEGRGTETLSASELLGLNGFEPVFIDMKNMEKYKAVDDLTSAIHAAQAPLGEPVYMFTAFPLPREGVETMDLRAAPSAPAIKDVPMPK